MNARNLLGAVALLASFMCVVPACQPPGPYIWVNHLSAEDTPEEPTIQPRDTIYVEVRGQDKMTGEFPVRDDGHYYQPQFGSIKVAGSTPTAAALMIANLLRGLIIDARVYVSISKPAPIKVNVVGEVKTPGTYELNRDRSVLGALSAAGWVNEFAHSDSIFVVRWSDKSRVRFRVNDVTSPEGPSSRFRLRDGDGVIVE